MLFKEAIYTDLRINTSEDADNLNQEYDFISLLNNCRIEKVNSTSKYFKNKWNLFLQILWFSDENCSILLWNLLFRLERILFYQKRGG